MNKNRYGRASFKVTDLDYKYFSLKQKVQELADLIAYGESPKVMKNRYYKWKK